MLRHKHVGESNFMENNCHIDVAFRHSFLILILRRVRFPLLVTQANHSHSGCVRWRMSQIFTEKRRFFSWRPQRLYHDCYTWVLPLLCPAHHRPDHDIEF